MHPGQWCRGPVAGLTRVPEDGKVHDEITAGLMYLLTKVLQNFSRTAKLRDTLTKPFAHFRRVSVVSSYCTGVSDTQECAKRFVKVEPNTTRLVKVCRSFAVREKFSSKVSSVSVGNFVNDSTGLPAIRHY